MLPLHQMSCIQPPHPPKRSVSAHLGKVGILSPQGKVPAVKWLLLIVLLIVILIVVALWRRTQMTSGTPAGADPASVASGQILVPPPVPPAAGVPPVFDPLVPVIPVDPVEPHEAVPPYEEATPDSPSPDRVGDERSAHEAPSESHPDRNPPTNDGH